MTVFNTNCGIPGRAGRYYLSGIDWVMAGLDRLNKNHTGLGNHSQLVLVLKGYLDKTNLRTRLDTILSQTSFLRGQIKRAWNLAPYWADESPDVFNVHVFDAHSLDGHSDAHSFDVRFFKLDSANQNSLDFFIQKCALTPFKDNKTMLGFDLVHCNKHSYLIMRFDHRIFDARGAEAFLEYILNDRNPEKKYNLPSQDAQLHSWKSRFLSGQCINRFLRKMYKADTKFNFESNSESNSEGQGDRMNSGQVNRINSAPKTRVAFLYEQKSRYKNQRKSKQKFEPETRQKFGLESEYKSGHKNLHCFYYTALSEDTTAAIEKNAIKKAGYLMDGVYILSCVAKGFDFLFKKNKSAGNMLIPINIDMRGAKFNRKKIFFNHLSFMLFNVQQGLSISEYIKNLKKQFIDQVKDKIPYHFINASLLMRIMPLGIISGFMNRKMRQLPCSFSFSYIGEQAFNLKHVQNLEVVNLFHLPLVPVNPGVGVFFTRFNKKLNMVISSFNDRLDGENGRYLQEKIISGMINGKV